MIKMKTRFKILLVISIFVMFYFALIPGFQICVDSEEDCSIWIELILLTRPVVTSNESIWNTGDGVSSWTGTVNGMEDPSLEDQITQNTPFIVTMIVLPFVIIGFVVVWDRK